MFIADFLSRVTPPNPLSFPQSPLAPSLGFLGGSPENQFALVDRYARDPLGWMRKALLLELQQNQFSKPSVVIPPSNSEDLEVF